MQGIKEGFHIGFDRDSVKCCSAQWNTQFAIVNPSVVTGSWQIDWQDYSCWSTSGAQKRSAQIGTCSHCLATYNMLVKWSHLVVASYGAWLIPRPMQKNCTIIFVSIGNSVRTFGGGLCFWQTGMALGSSRSKLRPDVILTLDASGSWGCGAFTSHHEWFQYTWPPPLERESTLW